MNEFSGSTGLLSQTGFGAASHALGTDACTLWSLIAVETSGYGFLPSRRPKILFERHIFSRLTQGRYDAAHPGISAPQRGGYAGGEAEYGRLEQALALDRGAALQSASWGLGQIMGYHAATLGYGDAGAMVEAFCDGEDAQLDGVARFIRRNAVLNDSLRRRQWQTVARLYNGADYACNEYDRKLDYYCERYATKGTPDVEVRAAQARLTFLKYAVGAVDGVFGAQTAGALNGFQRRHGLPLTAHIDAATQDALRTAAGF